MPDQRIILGIDPGTIILGYGLIAVDGSDLRLIQMGVLKLHQYHDHFIRLSKITERITGLINEFHPHEVAIEAPFYGKNVQSMLKLGRAQGAALAPALQIGIPVYEYAPRKIKQVITGYGNASKEQVATLLKHILKFDETPGYLDATDGVAVALCHHYQSGFHNKPCGPATWKDFLKQNPDRIH